MHEVGIAREIAGIALHRAEEAGARKITAVRVKIGEFTAVAPDCLCSCFQVVTQGTMAAGAALQVDMVPLAANCSDCGAPFQPDGFSFRCPACGSPRVEITGGRELNVQSIEVE